MIIRAFGLSGRILARADFDNAIMSVDKSDSNAIFC